MLRLSTFLMRRSTYNFCQLNSQERREKQDKLTELILKSLKVSYLSVSDTTVDSSGCGKMYKFVVESPQFVGKTKVQQHKMVVKALGDEVQKIHGFSLRTREPPATTQNK